MTVVLSRRSEIELQAVRRVAWEGEDVRLAPDALERIAAARRSFVALLDSDEELVVYGVTSGYGEGAKTRLDPLARKAHAVGRPHVDASFGEPLPERLTRAIVLARLANFLEGHAAVRPELAAAVAAMLDGGPLPPVPLRGNGGAGEIVALAHLFRGVADVVGLEEKEGLALVNGSPCASGLLADAALGGRRRLDLAHLVFALSVEGIAAPLDAYAPDFDELWEDEHEAEALRTMRGLLAGTAGARRAYQAPVSYRILPRVLGEAHRAVDEAERAAASSLRAVSDNPVYLPPDDAHAHGRVYSNGGYHNGKAAPVLDRLASTWANLAQLAERHAERLIDEGHVVPPSGQAYVGILLMVVVGYAEEAKQAAQTTVLPRGGFDQNDVVAPAFLAWEKERTAAARFVDCLAVLSALASQALLAKRREPAPALTPFLAEVREAFPPVDESRSLGPDGERLRDLLTARVLSV